MPNNKYQQNTTGCMIPKKACYAYCIHTAQYAKGDSISSLARQLLGDYNNKIAGQLWRSLKSPVHNKTMAYEYVWFYADSGHFDPSQIYLRMNHKWANYWKKGEQPDVSKKIIATNGTDKLEYNSLKEAAEDFFGTSANISRALRKVNKSTNRHNGLYKEFNTAFNWQWQYAEDKKETRGD